jgi:hypothetical protein
VGLTESKGPPYYLILCDGDESIVIERDFARAKIHSAQDFIVCTNHDTPSYGSLSGSTLPSHLEARKVIPGMQEFIEDSSERREFIQRKWEKAAKDQRDRKFGKSSDDDNWSGIPSIREGRLRRWVRAYPTMNDCTHFACILDPSTREIRWLSRGTKV